MLFYDMEIFKHYTLCVVIDVIKEETTVIETREHMIEFHKEHENDIWISYNGKSYDQYILKSWILGYDVWKVNDWIINQDRQGWQFADFRSVKLINYDVIQRRGGIPIGLKELQYNMGSSIVECDVHWNIDRPLTDDEKKRVIEYCIHDVEETIKVFLEVQPRFKAHLDLVKMYGLPIYDIDKTDAQLTAKILKAKKTQHRFDEFNIRLPHTLKLDKYQYIADWYMDKSNHTYDKTLTTTVHGLEITYAWGGFHGAKERCKYDGLIVDSDITSLYPSTMIIYDLLSRNIPEEYKHLYGEIKDERVRLKAIKDPLQEALKLILNTLYGILKDPNSPIYDPLMSNLVCIFGQLLMTDLIEKLEYALGDKIELIQANTDGVFYKFHDESCYPKYKQICEEWCKRTMYGIEHGEFTRYIGKDVNNYLAIKPDGYVHRKGAFAKELTNLSYELAVVNRAVVDYLTKDIPVEETVRGCKELRDFQMCCKLSSQYDYLMHGNQKLEHKYYRVFASKEKTDGGMFKVKDRNGKVSKQKVANTPKNCFIVNENILGKRCPRKLDKQFYIDLANDRISQFIGHDVKQLILW